LTHHRLHPQRPGKYHLYQWEASRDYNASPGLEGMAARLAAQAKGGAKAEVGMDLVTFFLLEHAVARPGR